MTENTNPTAGPGPLYPKINGPWRREVDGPRRNHLIENEWTSPELELLSGVAGWDASEKCDGTNVRIHFDGYSVSYGGRTNKAQMPQPLLDYLTATFQVELFEQHFGTTEVTVYAEGLGPRIQKNGNLYGDTKAAIFDVRIGGVWLLRPAVEEIAEILGAEVVPLELQGVTLAEAIEVVRSGLSSTIARRAGNEREAEGLVATLATGLLDRRGNRLQVKLKAVDLRK